MFRTLSVRLLRASSVGMLLLVLVLFQGVVAPGRAHAAAEPPSCVQGKVHVAIDPNNPNDLSNWIYGWLCSARGKTNSTVQLLIHGATYGHLYWDWPYQPEKYSYVDALTNAGYSTFNYDRIGVGRSSQPFSSEITLSSDAFVAHQLVQDLLAGTIGDQMDVGAIGDHRFSHVVLVGHSVGTMIAGVEAGTYHDVAGVVFSGQLQHDSLQGDNNVESTLYSANQDPAPRFKGLDSDYVTTMPGTRTEDFYYVPTSLLKVRDLDEETKEAASLGELNSFNVFFDDISKQIAVPVLDVIGQKDSMGCVPGGTDCSSSASVQQEEAPYFSPAAHLKVLVIPDTGHSLNLHTTAHQWFDDVIDWMGQYYNS